MRRGRPTQIFYPCWGLNRLTSKVGLCRSQRETTPGSCYVLPEDRARVVDRIQAARVAGQNNSDVIGWVVKGDAKNSQYDEFGGYNHQYGGTHAGKSVALIHHERDLPKVPPGSNIEYMVVPYRMPFLGPGAWARKIEVKGYLAVTSTNPLRAYYSAPSLWLTVLADSLFSAARESRIDQCIHDTHTMVQSSVACPLGDLGLPAGVSRREPWFGNAPGEVSHTVPGHYSGLQPPNNFTMVTEQLGWTPNQRRAFIAQLSDQLGHALFHHSVQDDMAASHINQGILKCGASCFHVMRFDVGITADRSPVVYEVNNFPGLGHSPMMRDKEFDSQYALHRELFRMLEMDESVRSPPAMRAEVENKRRHLWQPLLDPAERSQAAS